MKRKIIFFLFIVMIFLSLIKLTDILFKPSIYRFDEYIDLNSGDIREVEHLFSIKTKDKIRATLFSTEVRRLDINTPNDREWWFAHGKEFTLGSTTLRCGASYIEPCLYEEMSYLKYYKIQENVRKGILEDTLLCIKNNNRSMRELHNAIDEILHKYNIEKK